MTEAYCMLEVQRARSHPMGLHVRKKAGFLGTTPATEPVKQLSAVRPSKLFSSMDGSMGYYHN